MPWWSDAKPTVEEIGLCSTRALSATTKTSDLHWQQVKATGDTRTQLRRPESPLFLRSITANATRCRRLSRAQSSHPPAHTCSRAIRPTSPHDRRHLYTLMPGLISPLSASGTGTVAGMKRPYEDVSVPTYGQPHQKKRKVVHHLRHRQPVAHLVEPLAGGFGAPDDQGFIETQLRRAIAIQCRGIGFSSARPEAIEALTGLVHECTA